MEYYRFSVHHCLRYYAHKKTLEVLVYAQYFLRLNIATGAQTHNYNTRFRNNVRQIQLSHEFRRKFVFIMKSLELQTILHQVFFKKCTLTALMDLLYI